MTRAVHPGTCEIQHKIITNRLFFVSRIIQDPKMSPNLTLLLIIMTLSSVASQTFQYSRGWTNGKRDGRKNELQKILSPCQMHKLKELLEGKSLTENLLTPCDYIDEENERKSFKSDRRDSLYDAFQ